MDIEHIKSLVELMVANDLSRLEIQEGDTHVLLRRGQPVIAAATPTYAPMPLAQPAPAVSGGAAGAPTQASGASATSEAATAPAAVNETFIRSPMVGTFYSAADPESPPFVRVGDVVRPDSVVCLIEAMKVFNEIKAETAGRVTKALVKNGEAVEFDQPLFAVAPN